MEGSLNKWLDAWGYSEASGSLHVRVESVPGDHPYRTEIGGLLDPRGAIRAKAVFDVEGVPTICFLEGDSSVKDVRELMHGVRERAWNLLASTILHRASASRAVTATNTRVVKAPASISLMPGISGVSRSRPDIPAAWESGKASYTTRLNRPDERTGSGPRPAACSSFKLGKIQPANMGSIHPAATTSAQSS